MAHYLLVFSQLSVMTDWTWRDDFLRFFRFFVMGNSACVVSSSGPRFFPDRSTILLIVIGVFLQVVVQRVDC